MMQESMLNWYLMTLPSEQDIQTKRAALEAQAHIQHDLKDLLVLIQRRLFFRASWYVRIYRYEIPDLDMLDLVQEANRRILERSEQILEKDDFVSYMLAVGYASMREACYRGWNTPPCVSLDEPSFEDSEMPLHECLPDTLLPASPYAHEQRDYTSLYEAIDRLPADQRTIVLRCYGIHENAPEPKSLLLADLKQADENYACYHERAALSRLYFLLKEHYPHYAGQIPLTPPSRRNRQTADTYRQRLDEAYARLQAHNQPITVGALKQETGIQKGACSAYLAEKLPWRLVPTEQRQQQHLDEAYERLQAQGQKITKRALAREARVASAAVNRYLQEKRGRVSLRLEAYQRLDRIYTMLQEQGCVITQSMLRRMSGAGFQTVKAYLAQRGSNQPSA